MRIFMFKSDAESGLRAFAGDSAGSKLPQRHGPWHAVGVIRPEKDPPHQFSRAAIEKAIETEGFQLWRMKPTKKAGTEPKKAGGEPKKAGAEPKKAAAAE
jgi:hypothetical protein